MEDSRLLDAAETLGSVNSLVSGRGAYIFSKG